jgi:hypothetical protein
MFLELSMLADLAADDEATMSCPPSSKLPFYHSRQDKQPLQNRVWLTLEVSMSKPTFGQGWLPVRRPPIGQA